MAVTTGFSPALDQTARRTVARPAHRVFVHATDRMHPGVFGLAVGSYAALLAVFWLFFTTGVDMAINLVICTVYLAMYLGVPLIMARIASRAAATSEPGRLSAFLRGGLETASGTLSGWSAMTQVLIVPVSLAVGAVAMGIAAKVLA
ncbi:MAG: hypothetical protein KIS96_06665 [Bauldia sp.]|nr:hypothetical protein [Bauldia sp.]